MVIGEINVYGKEKNISYHDNFRHYEFFFINFSTLLQASPLVRYYRADSLLFYIVSALTAFVTGYTMKNKKPNVKRWLLLYVRLFITCCLASIILTFITTEGIPADYWGFTIYNTLVNKNVSPALCTMLSVSLVKTLDVLVSLLFVILSVFLTPKAIKTNAATVKNDVMEI